MRSKKRLGKSLEELSHLFLSDSSPQAETVREAPAERPEEAEGPVQTRVWLSAGLVERPVSAFFTANLAISLARHGRRVFVVEAAPPPALEQVLGMISIQPGLRELLDQSDKQVSIEGPPGVRVLSFRFSEADLEGYTGDERDILYQILAAEEETADRVMVHAAYSEARGFDRLLKSVQGVVLAAAPDLASISETYRICKRLFLLQPGLRIGFLVYEHPDHPNQAVWRQKLEQAAERFLGKKIEWFGTIPEDPLIECSIAAKVPLTMLYRTSKIASCFGQAAEQIQREPSGRRAEITPPSFFERLSQLPRSGAAG